MKDIYISNSNINVTSFVYKRILNSALEKFKKKHSLKNITKVQFYGFANYNSNKPSLKSDLEKIAGEYVNGKYFYEKNIILEKGEEHIKIKIDYLDLILTYLSYSSLKEYVEKVLQNDYSTEYENQIKLLDNTKTKTEKFYYECYYVAENSKLSKGQVVFSNNWKKVNFKFIHHLNNEIVTYTYEGKIVSEDSFIHFFTKLDKEPNKKVIGAYFIFYVGNSKIVDRNILLGTYSGFDKHNRTIAGKMILKKSKTEKEMIENSLSDFFSPYLSELLRNKRIIVENTVYKNYRELYKKVFYANFQENFFGDIILNLSSDGYSGSIYMNVKKNDLVIKSNHNDIFFENSEIKFLLNEKIIKMNLCLSGNTKFSYLEVLLQYNNENNNNFKGSYIGIYSDGNIVNGKAEVIKKNDL